MTYTAIYLSLQDGDANKYGTHDLGAIEIEASSNNAAALSFDETLGPLLALVKGPKDLITML